MTLTTILIIVLVVALVGGAFSNVNGGPFYGYGHWGGGSLGLVLIVLIILALSGRI